MSTHSYTRLWTHLIWETLNREPMLDKRAAAKASAFLTEYSIEKGIYMKINYFNADRLGRMRGLSLCSIRLLAFCKAFLRSKSYGYVADQQLNSLEHSQPLR